MTSLSSRQLETRNCAHVSDSLTGRQEQAKVDMCDNCVIKAYQFQAGSPINGGRALQSNYSSLTASCSKTGFPLASSTIPFPEYAKFSKLINKHTSNEFTRATPTNTSPEKCDGKTYTIKSGDTCRSISEAQGVATSWLLSDNALKAFCAEFPTSGDLCVRNTCKIYTVKPNDTCVGIAKANKISQVQLHTCKLVHVDAGSATLPLQSVY